MTLSGLRERAPRFVLALWLAGLPATSLEASGPSRERVLRPGTAGANRAPVDTVLLTQADPVRYAPDLPVGLPVGGLDDLRLFDAAGKEVPYLLMLPEPHAPEQVSGKVRGVVSTKTESGFEIELPAARTVESVTLSGIPSPFLKRYRLEGSGDREHWTLLVAEGTLFDLPDQQLRELTARFAPGDFRYLRFTWDDRNSARVSDPRGATARTGWRSAPAVERVPLAFERLASEPRVSRFRVRLPGRHLPIAALELTVAPGNLLRDARVVEQRLQGSRVDPATLGAATLRRAAQGDTVASALSITMSAPLGRDLELIVRDGDSGPLALTGVAARLLPLPWIYFESADGAPLTARFGDASAPAPHYDLEAARGQARSAATGAAAWDAERTISTGAEAAPEAAAVELGASIDAAGFRYARALPDTSPGLQSLKLDLAVVAHSRDLADVRLVTADGRQVPYLLERRDEPMVEALGLTPRAADPRRAHVSRYRATLPYARLPQAVLLVETSARVFERTVEVTLPAADRERGDLFLARGDWRHSDPETTAPLFSIEIPSTDALAVDIAIDEGDNGPLALNGATLQLPAYRLRFFGGQKGVRLLYGSPGLDHARYDLALLAPRLVGEEGTAIAAAPEGEAGAAPGDTAPRIFWGVLVVSVLALLALLGRLLRRSEAHPQRP